jgi:dUTP pyrophosphatase
METSDLQKHLRQLQNLENQINEGTEGINFMDELNGILNGLSSDLQLDVMKNNTFPVLNYVNKSNNPDPFFAEEGDSGFDMRAYIPDYPNYEIVKIGRVKTIPTGLYFEVEKGLEIQARSRSGLADKSNVFVLNSPGTIDSRYRGQVKIILANLGENDFKVNNGDRIAQGVVCPVYGEGRLTMKKVEKLSESGRGTKGFGSTGYK